MYFANCAGLGWGVSTHTKGIVVSVSGYSQRQALLMKDVVEALLGLDPEAEAPRFELVKEQLLRNYRNWDFERADTHAHFAARLCLSTGRWPVAEKLEVATAATPSSLAAFKRRLLRGAVSRIFVHGNVVEPDALAVAEDLEQMLIEHGTVPISRALQPEVRVVDLPPGRYLVRFPAPSPTEQNSAALLLFMGGQTEADPKTSATLSLLSQVIKEPAFTTLRTREQLGYVVSASIMDFGAGRGSTVSSLCVSILSKTHSPPMIEERSKIFLKRFLAELKGMEEGDLRKHKASLTTKYLEPPKRLSAEFAQWWGEIQYDDLQWERYEELAAALEEVTLDDLVTYYEALVLDPASRRQISVHCHCAKHAIGGDFEQKAKEAKRKAREEEERGAEEKVGGGEEGGQGRKEEEEAVVEEEEEEEDTDVEATLVDLGEWKAWQNSMPLFAADIDVKKAGPSPIES